MEHEGKLLCAACLARLARATERRRERLAALRRSVAAAGGALALWIVFYWIGALLVKIPPDFHDGTIWKEMVERSGQ